MTWWVSKFETYNESWKHTVEELPPLLSMSLASLSDCCRWQVVWLMTFCFSNLINYIIHPFCYSYFHIINFNVCFLNTKWDSKILTKWAQIQPFPLFNNYPSEKYTNKNIIRLCISSKSTRILPKRHFSRHLLNSQRS